MLLGFCFPVSLLLIVLNGIEILFSLVVSFCSSELLIVLNGIEIVVNPCRLFSYCLLIVLNGIEIQAQL